MIFLDLASPTADAQLFISRPRRFGKSLTVSAFKALFSGRRELFEGLAIDKTESTNTTRPWDIAWTNSTWPSKCATGFQPFIRR